MHSIHPNCYLIRHFSMHALGRRNQVNQAASTAVIANKIHYTIHYARFHIILFACLYLISVEMFLRENPTIYVSKWGSLTRVARYVVGGRPKKLYPCRVFYLQKLEPCYMCNPKICTKTTKQLTWLN